MLCENEQKWKEKGSEKHRQGDKKRVESKRNGRERKKKTVNGWDMIKAKDLMKDREEGKLCHTQ